ncbi:MULTISPECIES: IS3 family transposase [unclassified Crossiella]|uniref:IS3 family transposase n=1 Tax=unclassified Crossiella TaxID=2620835 RepID=UPI0020000034|nr:MULTISPECIES: IS3 family transposase [unclassified Crossiella]MCK2245510.1 IS3 family transposase [Crossiella sp. S99.2]MCK2259167.1 IS3 family transposase [Crossiella sp. S99.1]
MDAERDNFSVTMMCRLLDVSRSGFYEWSRRVISAGARRRRELTETIREVFVDSGRTYGYRRVHAELERRGIRVDDEVVRRLMRAARLVPVQVKRRRGLTAANRAAAEVPDLVDRDFTAEVPGAKMVGDITQIDTAEGPLFLASVIDCFSKSVLGWSFGESYPASVVCAALEMAGTRVPFPENAIFHSDRGSQYTSAEFASALRDHGVRQSVGRTGICFDNAMAESFFGKLKTELTHHQTYATRAAARRDIVRFIEGFYNRRRLHSGLGYRPPAEVLAGWFVNQSAA